MNRMIVILLLVCMGCYSGLAWAERVTSFEDDFDGNANDPPDGANWLIVDRDFGPEDGDDPRLDGSSNVHQTAPVPGPNKNRLESKRRVQVDGSEEFMAEWIYSDIVSTRADAFEAVWPQVRARK